MQDQILKLLSARHGHFLFESGHHGDLWLDLESLFFRPELIRPLAAALASRLRTYDIEIACGPLVEGSFVGLLVALELGVEFVYSERFFRPTQDGLFPAGYRIPKALRSLVGQKRVAIVNDVINAGSAVRGTFDDLLAYNANIVAIGSLLVLGTSASEYASSKNVALEWLATHPNNLWTPSECPLCAAGAPLEDVELFKLAVERT
jgi:orotate phosphoribosyltransferase